VVEVVLGDGVAVHEVVSRDQAAGEVGVVELDPAVDDRHHHGVVAGHAVPRLGKVNGLEVGRLVGDVAGIGRDRGRVADPVRLDDVDGGRRGQRGLHLGQRRAAGGDPHVSGGIGSFLQGAAGGGTLEEAEPSKRTRRPSAAVPSAGGATAAVAAVATVAAVAAVAAVETSAVARAGALAASDEISAAKAAPAISRVRFPRSMTL
jgi:hypothetical protein